MKCNNILQITNNSVNYQSNLRCRDISHPQGFNSPHNFVDIIIEPMRNHEVNLIVSTTKIRYKGERAGTENNKQGYLDEHS